MYLSSQHHLEMRKVEYFEMVSWSYICTQVLIHELSRAETREVYKHRRNGQDNQEINRCIHFLYTKRARENHDTSCLIFHKLILYDMIRFYIFSVSIKHFSWLLDKFYRHNTERNLSLQSFYKRLRASGPFNFYVGIPLLYYSSLSSVPGSSNQHFPPLQFQSYFSGSTLPSLFDRATS